MDAPPISIAAPFIFSSRRFMSFRILIQSADGGLGPAIGGSGEHGPSQQRAIIGGLTRGFRAAGVGIHHQGMGHDAVCCPIAVQVRGDSARQAIDAGITVTLHLTNRQPKSNALSRQPLQQTRQHRIA